MSARNTYSVESAAQLDKHQHPTVTLTTEQVGKAWELAGERNESYKEIDGGTVRGEHSSREAHYRGILCEMAVSTYYGSDIDTDVHRTGDDGVDLVIDGWEVDVKGVWSDLVRHEETKLLQKAKHGAPADIYYLVEEVASGKYRLLGFCTGETVEDREPRREPGDIENFVVPQSELTPPHPPSHRLVSESDQIE